MRWASYNLNRDWSNVIFTDESTLRLCGTRKKVWLKKGDKYIVRTVKHSQKTYVYGCMSEDGFGKLVHFTGTLTDAHMCQLYKKGLLPTADLFYKKKQKEMVVTRR